MKKGLKVVCIILAVVMLAALLVNQYLKNRIRTIKWIDGHTISFRATKDKVKKEFGAPDLVEDASYGMLECWTYENMRVFGESASVKFIFGSRNQRLVRFNAYISVGSEDEAELLKSKIEQAIENEFDFIRGRITKRMIPDGKSIQIGNVTYYFDSGKYYGSDELLVGIDVFYKDGR